MSFLSIGQSALAAAQLGLSTTSNNIANASTPGYNEEQIIQSENGGFNTGSGFIGTGTAVTTVQRSYNSFLTTQVNAAQSSYSSLNTGYTQISQINNMFANTTAGLSPAIQTFFSDVQTATANPSAASSRETVLTSAQTLASQFQSTSAQLSQLGDGVNQELTSTVQSINNYTSQIATLNQQIQTAEASSAGQPPNSLLDARDLAVANLSQEIGVTIVPQGNAYNVFVGNGQPVVVGTNAYQLTTVPSPTNANQLEVGYVNGTAGGTVTQLPENSLTGGTVGGLLQFRSQSLIPAENAVGQMAIGLANTVNAQQELGQTLTGQPGGPMFATGSPAVTASTSNSGTLQIQATISDSSALTADNYSLSYDANGNYELTDLTTNVTTNLGNSFPPAPTAPGIPAGAPNGTIDGLTFTSNGGVPNTGDHFLIQPTATGAAQFSVVMNNTSQIAMAAPIVTSAGSVNLANGLITDTNTGTGSISAGVVTPVPAGAVTPTPPLYGAGGSVYPNLTDQVSIVFNGAPNAGTYNVTDLTTGTALATNIAYVSGQTIPGPADGWNNGWTVAISGTPAPNDTFTVGPNTNGTGDSRNGVLMAGLQTTNTLNNNTTSIQGAYSQLVSQVGNQTAQLQATSTSANTQLTNATNAQQAVSGVNLDEEASNLLRYQEAYQAAAKVMSTASTLFDSLLAVVQ